MDESVLELIDRNHKALSGQGPSGSPESLAKYRYFYDPALVWSSNALEGYSYSMSETSLLLREGIVTGGKSYRDTYAVVGLGKALDRMYGLAGLHEVTESDILEFHRLLGDSLDNRAVPGSYRDVQVYVGEDSMPAPKDLPPLLDAFRAFLKNQRGSLHPVVFAALSHLKFVLIHPFADGNGRVSRVLMNACLVQEGYLPVIIHPVEGRLYSRSIREAKSDQGEAFVDFICEKELAAQKEFMKFMGSGDRLQDPKD
jgi:Fic family protein